MIQPASFPTTRLRRLRKTPALRALVQEIHLRPDHLVLPLFIKENLQSKCPILSMPGHFQLSLNDLKEEVDTLLTLGLKQVMLFGIPAHKDEVGSEAYASEGVIQSAIRQIKAQAPELLVMADLCLCEYTNHGHCGILFNNSVDNDTTLPLLAKTAVSFAKAGADIIAPSGCIDGMVQWIRKALDEAGFPELPILSYAVKYASAFYGPFRQAAEGAPKTGDRRGYQMNHANVHEALYECALDCAEGADMLMVKPAHTYLDIICRIKEAFPHLPLAAYHTSGEFAMLKAASEKGWIDEPSAVLEVLTAIHRAGAQIIITYYAKEVLDWL